MQGGKEKDARELWDEESHFAELKSELQHFIDDLPEAFQYTPASVDAHHATRTLGQLTFLHLSYQQTRLFLHRSVLSMVGSTQNSPTSTMPQEFINSTREVAIEAATRIAEILQEGQDRGAHVVAPFTGYCAFNASLVHLVRMFDSRAGAQEEAKKHMETCLKFLLYVKQYWGLFHSITDSLKILYKKFAESYSRGGNLATHGDISRMLQYGDWFLKYPHGFQPESVQEDPSTRSRIPGDMRSPSDDAALSHRPDLQTADEFFSRLGPRQAALSADAVNHMENFMRSPSDARSSPGHVRSPTVHAGNSMQQSPSMHTPPGTMNTPPSLVSKPPERPLNIDTHKATAHVRRSSIAQPSPSSYGRNFGTQGSASQLTSPLSASPLSARLPRMPTTSAAQFSNYAQQALTARGPVTQGGGGGGVHFNHQPQQQPVSQEQTSQPPYLYDTDSGLIAALSTGLWQGFDQQMNTADVSGFPEHHHHHHPHHQTTGGSAWFMPFNSVPPEFETTHSGLDTLGMLAATSGLVEGGAGGWQGQRHRQREGQEAVVKPEYHRENVTAADSGNGDMM
jgi:hypothetical protein